MAEEAWGSQVGETVESEGSRARRGPVSSEVAARMEPGATSPKGGVHLAGGKWVLKPQEGAGQGGDTT